MTWENGLQNRYTLLTTLFCLWTASLVIWDGLPYSTFYVKSKTIPRELQNPFIREKTRWMNWTRTVALFGAARSKWPSYANPLRKNSFKKTTRSFSSRPYFPLHKSRLIESQLGLTSVLRSSGLDPFQTMRLFTLIKWRNNFVNSLWPRRVS